MPLDTLLDNSVNLMWSFFAVQSAMNGIARELVFAGVDTVVHERLGPPDGDWRRRVSGRRTCSGAGVAARIDK